LFGVVTVILRLVFASRGSNRHGLASLSTMCVGGGGYPHFSFLMDLACALNSPLNLTVDPASLLAISSHAASSDARGRCACFAICVPGYPLAVRSRLPRGQRGYMGVTCPVTKLTQVAGTCRRLDFVSALENMRMVRRVAHADAGPPTPFKHFPALCLRLPCTRRLRFAPYQVPPGTASAPGWPCP
jgi:hypothetical protein